MFLIFRSLAWFLDDLVFGIIEGGMVTSNFGEKNNYNSCLSSSFAFLVFFFNQVL